jgi:hypothetical protein
MRLHPCYEVYGIYHVLRNSRQQPNCADGLLSLVGSSSARL